MYPEDEEKSVKPLLVSLIFLPLFRLLPLLLCAGDGMENNKWWLIKKVITTELSGIELRVVVEDMSTQWERNGEIKVLTSNLIPI